MAPRIAIVLLAGAALGLAGRWSDYGSEPLTLLFALGSPWVVLAFALGALSPGRLEGAAAGATGLAVSVAVYYATMLLLERQVGGGYAASMTLVWGAPALALGALLGCAGAAVREPAARLPAAALLGGALAGEALLFLSRGYEGEEAAVLLGQLTLGCVLPLAAGSARRHDAVVLTGALAFMALVGNAALRVLARRYGWGGA
jgi:hypothetical protein